MTEIKKKQPKPAKSLFQKSLKDYTVLFLIILLLFSVVVAFAKTLFGPYSLKDFVNDLFNSLMGAIIPLILFNVIFEYLMRDHQSKVVSDAIAETLLLNDETLSRFSEETRKNFIKNCTQSLIGKEEGELLYATLFVPYLVEKQRFRKNMKYYIFNTEIDPVKDREQATLFDPRRYIWVLEDLSYEKSYLPLDEELLIGFSYNEMRLEQYFANDRIVFRENLALDPHEIARIKSMGIEELLQFMETSLQLCFELNGQRAALIGAAHDDNGFILRYAHQGEKLKEAGGYTKLKVSFRMPQLRSYNKFVVVISEPTYGVDVLYSNQLPNTEVTAVPFFDGNDLVVNLPNQLTRIELSDWVLPTSGAVFVWKEIEPVELAPTALAAG